MIASADNLSDSSLMLKRKRPPQAPRGLQAMILGGKVGEGTFGQVFKAIDRGTNDVTALKRFKTDERYQEYGFPHSALREIRVLKALKGPNIVNMREVLVCNEDDMKSAQKNEYLEHGIQIGDVFIVQDFVPLNLNQILHTSHKDMPETLKKYYIKQLLDGVFFFHYYKIIHRDLKPENILVTADNVLKIADWGSVRTLSFNQDREVRMTIEIVTRWYRCPELYFHVMPYGPEVDMWSVGCIVYEILTGRAPFRSDQPIEVLDQIFKLCGSPDADTVEMYKKKEVYHNLKKIIPENKPDNFQSVIDKYKLSGSAIEFIKPMLCLNPKTRIGANDALDSNYLWESPQIPQNLDTLPKFKPDEIVAQYNEIRRKYDEERARMQNPGAAKHVNPNSSTAAKAGGAAPAQGPPSGINASAHFNTQNKFKAATEKKKFTGVSTFKVTSAPVVVNNNSVNASTSVVGQNNITSNSNSNINSNNSSSTSSTTINSNNNINRASANSINSAKFGIEIRGFSQGISSKDFDNMKRSVLLPSLHSKTYLDCVDHQDLYDNKGSLAGLALYYDSPANASLAAYRINGTMHLIAGVHCCLSAVVMK